MIDSISIIGLKVTALIGVYPYEKEIEQLLLIDLSFSMDAKSAAKSDDISHTLDYSKICETVISFVKRTHCNLLETLADRLASFLKQHYQLPQLQLSITKNPLDMPVSGVKITIQR